MKKFMLLCTVGLVFACTDVGKASNVSLTSKTAIVCSDQDLSDVIEFAKNYDGSVLFIVDDCKEFEMNSLLTINSPVFIAPNPVTIEYTPDVSFLPYKQKGQLKAKFHPEHLFNPVKLC